MNRRPFIILVGDDGVSWSLYERTGNGTHGEMIASGIRREAEARLLASAPLLLHRLKSLLTASGSHHLSGVACDEARNAIITATEP